MNDYLFLPLDPKSYSLNNESNNLGIFNIKIFLKTNTHIYIIALTFLNNAIMMSFFNKTVIFKYLLI